MPLLRREAKAGGDSRFHSIPAVKLRDCRSELIRAKNMPVGQWACRSTEAPRIDQAIPPSGARRGFAASAPPSTALRPRAWFRVRPVFPSHTDPAWNRDWRRRFPAESGNGPTFGRSYRGRKAPSGTGMRLSVRPPPRERRARDRTLWPRPGWASTLTADQEARTRRPERFAARRGLERAEYGPGLVPA